MKLIDQTSDLSFQISKNAKVSYFKVEMVDDTADQISTMKVTFDHVLFLPEKVILEIFFPPEIKISKDEKYTSKPVRDMSESIDLLRSVDTNSLIIYKSTDKYYSALKNHVFSISNIKNPVR